jgi:hypothetical protein
MGIDFVVESTIKPDVYDGKKERYLTYAWRNIEWEKIFELLNIKLHILYDNAIDYWSVEQVEEMYKMLKLLYETPQNILYGYDEDDTRRKLNVAKKLNNDTWILTELFSDYVKNKAIINVI